MLISPQNSGSHRQSSPRALLYDRREQQANTRRPRDPIESPVRGHFWAVSIVVRCVLSYPISPSSIDHAAD